MSKMAKFLLILVLLLSLHLIYLAFVSGQLNGATMNVFPFGIVDQERLGSFVIPELILAVLLTFGLGFALFGSQES